MSLNKDPPNPYAAPATISATPSPMRWPVRAYRLHRLIALQLFVIIGSLAMEAYEHQTIVALGPVFSLIGLIIAVLALRRRDWLVAIFGCSAIAFSLLIVFLINYNSWGPAQGDRPITILCFVYTVVALPFAVWLALDRSGTGQITAEDRGT